MQADRAGQDGTAVDRLQRDPLGRQVEQPAQDPAQRGPQQHPAGPHGRHTELRPGALGRREDRCLLLDVPPRIGQVDPPDPEERDGPVRHAPSRQSGRGRLAASAAARPGACCCPSMSWCAPGTSTTRSWGTSRRHV